MAFMVPDWNSELFQQIRGLKQGDLISPTIFNTVLKFAFRKLQWNGKGVNIHGQHLSNLGSADDALIFAKNAWNFKK